MLTWRQCINSQAEENQKWSQYRNGKVVAAAVINSDIISLRLEIVRYDKLNRDDVAIWPTVYEGRIVQPDGEVIFETTQISSLKATEDEAKLWIANKFHKMLTDMVKELKGES